MECEGCKCHTCMTHIICMHDMFIEYTKILDQKSWDAIDDGSSFKQFCMHVLWYISINRFKSDLVCRVWGCCRDEVSSVFLNGPFCEKASVFNSDNESWASQSSAQEAVLECPNFKNQTNKKTNRR